MAEQNPWACVGCTPPHWENGVYVDRLTIHPLCRRHNEDGVAVYFDDQPGRMSWCITLPPDLYPDIGSGVVGMSSRAEAEQARAAAIEGEAALRGFLGPAWVVPATATT
ncbi:hypothetical protein H7K45_27815 [Mycobacterium yunnanensis]|uniref:Uncharacterized protein n=1 Tax=Mycobacterium yunnanensis TaxID=368477 RepID=A0A9X3C3G5_9MYCO|nr:hypothetical protein [Mycobacterium yunnanensis]MCV7424358.1 hypothetical protein [Mycobacterium yunnanensis]